MNKDMLVNDSVNRGDDAQSLLEQIEKKLAELDKKKKADMEKSELEKETIENHIRTALQMQIITHGLAAYYKEKLDKASQDRKVKQEKELFSMKELPGMIEARRQQKIRTEAERIMSKIEENPDYHPTAKEKQILSDWDRVKTSSQEPIKE